MRIANEFNALNNCNFAVFESSDISSGKVRIMGGIFSSPSPPPPPPPPPPAPDPVPTESEAEIAEKAARERRRRAQSETIATSWRGVDDPNATAKPAPKRLLGE